MRKTTCLIMAKAQSWRKTSRYTTCNIKQKSWCVCVYFLIVGVVRPKATVQNFCRCQQERSILRFSPTPLALASVALLHLRCLNCLCLATLSCEMIIGLLTFLTCFSSAACRSWRSATRAISPSRPFLIRFRSECASVESLRRQSASKRRILALKNSS